MVLAELRDEDLVAKLEEHVAGNQQLEELVDEISRRLLRHVVFGCVVVRLIGDENVVWASDYPHPDAHFPGSVAESLEKMSGIAEASRRKIFASNAARFYGIDVPRS